MKPDDDDHLNPQASQSNRVCNALALLQCVASHAETRSVFLSGEWQLFVFIIKLFRSHFLGLMSLFLFRF